MLNSPNAKHSSALRVLSIILIIIASLRIVNCVPDPVKSGLGPDPFVRTMLIISPVPGIFSTLVSLLLLISFRRETVAPEE